MRPLAALLLLATACAPASQSISPTALAPGQAAWTPHAAHYILVAINGHDLPAASPEEPNVTIDGVTLELDGDGGYTMALTGRRGMEKTPGTIDVHGTYAVRGDTLMLTPGMPRDLPDPARPGGPEAARFTWCDERDTLYLRDLRGNLYTLRAPLLDVAVRRTCSAFIGAR